MAIEEIIGVALAYLLVGAIAFFVSKKRLWVGVVAIALFGLIQVTAKGSDGIAFAPSILTPPTLALFALFIISTFKKEEGEKEK